MIIKVINIKNTKRYNKEPFKKDDELYIFCGRPKKMSNPYEIGKDGNREEVIEKFRELANSESNINKEINNLADYAKKHKIKEVLDNKLNARLF